MIFTPAPVSTSTLPFLLLDLTSPASQLSSLINKQIGDTSYLRVFNDFLKEKQSFFIWPTFPQK